MMEKVDIKKQKRITEMFAFVPKPANVENDSSETAVMDIEDIAGGSSDVRVPYSTVNKRKRITLEDEEDMMEEEAAKSWREVLGDPPPMGTTKVVGH